MNNASDQLRSLEATLPEQVLAATGASGIGSVKTVQELWSGFGRILRLRLQFATEQPPPERQSVILKHVQPPQHTHHPRGWDSAASTQRKLHSYRVEEHWYRHYAGNCNTLCAVPRLIASCNGGHHTWLLMEDLDVRFPHRHSQLSVAGCKPCLQWLARFHALHYQHDGEGLWPTGTYWHLQTRHDEYAAMQDGELKRAASRLDRALTDCPGQTLVHGDAKVANFCFSPAGDKVAMVDFQYTGRGCGIRDVVYFLGSCLSSTDCENHADSLLDIYFAELNTHLPVAARVSVEQQWRDLYAIAWADFHRFLAGWMPEHHKINRYMDRMTKQALSRTAKSTRNV